MFSQILYQIMRDNNDYALNDDGTVSKNNLTLKLRHKLCRSVVERKKYYGYNSSNKPHYRGG